MRLRKPSKKATLAIIAIIITIGVVSLLAQKANAPNSESNDAVTVTSSKKGRENKAGFDKSRYSIDDPASPWVIVNKKRPLPSGYAPSDLGSYGLRSQANEKLAELLSAEGQNGNSLKVISAYRSQAQQTSTYNGYVATDGQARADTYSARPRHSEHQTGWAADLGNGVCDLEICFGDTTAGKWLANNAHKYGFIIRYGKGNEAKTGYQYEPWHIRYVGKDLAHELHKSDQTMEEFFGLTAAPTY